MGLFFCVRHKLFILCFFFGIWFHFFHTNAFFDGDNGIDIFKTIDDGVKATEQKLYKDEMTGYGERSISQELNTILKSQWVGECLQESFTLEDLEKIKTSDSNVADLLKVLKGECLDETGTKIPANTISKLRQNLISIDTQKRKRAQVKWQRLYQIARIWLYSDGDTTNSPFDLVDDIKEIEKIIFTQKLEYNGQEIDWDKEFNNFLDGYPNGSSSSSWWSSSSSGWNGSGSTGTGTWYTYKKYTPFTFYTQTGSYVCSDTATLIEQSGLNEETITELLNGTGSNTWSGSTGSWSNTWSGSTGSWSIENIPTTGYTKANDNSLWPCNEFFCIRIEFVIKNYKLLAGGNSWSIEAIIKKSNEHLKKFANTSLVQSKMTQNNFELWLTNLSLPDIFHMWLQVTKRVPPILNIENNENRVDYTQYSCKNMIGEYYNNLDIEASRENDIWNYKKTNYEGKAIEWCEELSVARCVQLKQELAKIQGIRERRSEYFSKVVDSKASIEDSDIYFKEFVELESFGGALKDYVEQISAIIKQMNKIPIRSS